MSACPCCGFRDGSGNPKEIAKTLRLTKAERAMFGVFASRFGSFLTAQDIASAVYADDPNGGPLWADSCVAVFMGNFRTKLRAKGLDIEARLGRQGGRRMIWAKTGRAAKK